MTTVKAKVTTRLDHVRPPSPLKVNGVSSRPNVSSRPPSPSKLPSPSPVARPKAKINLSANITVRKTPNTSPRSAVPFRAPSPFKVNQRSENKTVPGSNVSSISVSRPPSAKPHAVGVQKSISSSPTVPRMDRPPVLSNVAGRANTTSPELLAPQRKASVTLHPTATGVSRTAPSSPQVPSVVPHMRSPSTLSSLRDSQPSPVPSTRITSKLTKLSVNVKASDTSEPATPISMRGLGHRPRRLFRQTRSLPLR
ncbi:hypothetical protein BJ322DRAFT_740969 [Thelephora terrestris]|uniref:Uncharacterized protein n=1 Tax=Thelephora terrestris TaxID=56493 RepID=A0A9P6L6P7_9AGAM|nr:hypothetical protein BJ322DRAFT_740969 [Thelephora terrestris]